MPEILIADPACWSGTAVAQSHVRRKRMLTWMQLGGYLSIVFTVFAGGVGVCYLVLWRE
jgi:hypothetical protein